MSQLLSKKHLNEPSSYLHYCMIVVLFISTILLVGSFDSRLANSVGDDHPVVIARFFSNPDFWKEDSGYASAQFFGRASLPNVLAIFSLRLSDRGPYVLSWLYVFIQNIGIGLGFFLIATLLSESTWVAWLVGLLSFAMGPWVNNLAYYPDMMHSPYPGHLVMPFIALSAYFLLKGQVKWSFVPIAMAGLIHPSQVIQFVLIGLIFLLLQNRRLFSWNYFIFGIPPVLMSLIVPFFLVPQPENALTSSELLPSALLNPHLVPWESTTFWPWGFPSILGCFWLSFLATRGSSGLQKMLRNFWFANFVSLLVWGTVHVIGVKLRILPFILLCPFRVSVINSVLLAPIGFSYLVRQIKSGNLNIALASSSLIGFLLFSKSGLFWGPLLVLSLSEFQTHRNLKSNLPLLLFCLWWILFFSVGRPLRLTLGEELSGLLRRVLAPGANLTLLKINIILAFSAVLFLLVQWKKTPKRWLNGFMGGMTVLFVFWQSWTTGRLALTGELKERWELQQWARDSTPPNSIFMIETGSWRGVANRKVQIVGYPKVPLLPYLKSREPLIFAQKLSRLYWDFGTNSFSDLNEENVQKLAQSIGGTYWVEAVSAKAKKLPVVFENKSWRVYAIAQYSSKGLISAF